MLLKYFQTWSESYRNAKTFFSPDEMMDIQVMGPGAWGSARSDFCGTIFLGCYKKSSVVLWFGSDPKCPAPDTGPRAKGDTLEMLLGDILPCPARMVTLSSPGSPDYMWPLYWWWQWLCSSATHNDMWWHDDILQAITITVSSVPVCGKSRWLPSA